MIKLAVLAILNLSGVLSKLDCKTPVVCDPSLESDIFLGASHFVDELACQTSCTIGHPSNPCKFFTFVPGAQDQVPNCYKMKQCNEMSKPIVGSVSGAWSCDDPEIQIKTPWKWYIGYGIQDLSMFHGLPSSYHAKSHQYCGPDGPTASIFYGI